MGLGGRCELERGEIEGVVAEQAVDAERQRSGGGSHQSSRPRSSGDEQRPPSPPMAKTMAVVWKGGIGPLSVVRLASVAHSRIAPIAEKVAVLEDAIFCPSPIPICRVALAAPAALISAHATCHQRCIQDRPRPAQPRRRRSRRQRRQAAHGPRRGRQRRAPTSSSTPSCSSPAIRPRTSCASRRLPRAARALVEALAAETGDGGPGVIVGTIWAEDGKLYNSIALLDGGRIQAVRHKVDLPNYGVFDEKRVFDVRAHAGSGQLPRRAHRRADLRGHLEGRGVRVPAGDGLGDADRRPTARRSTGRSPTSA